MSTEQKKNYALPIIVMFALFAMISFVTGLQNPMGVIVKLSVEHDFVKGRSGNESRYFSENADNAVRTVNGISYRRFADTLEQ